jgi:hypothetical protein
MARRALVAILVLLVPALRCPAATPAAVREAIEKSRNWLYAQQHDDGTWENEFDGHGDQRTGQTALAVYALLAGGESHQDPRIAKAIAYLKKTETTGVYALGLRCQVWLALPQSQEVRAAMAKDARILLGSLKRSGDGKGFYDYNPSGSRFYSHSRSQYAVLGLWAAAQSGFEVPIEYWQLVERAWIADQDGATGGWSYWHQPDYRFPLTNGMTAVGVATLFITQDYVHAAESLNCNGNIRNPAIERGIEYLAANFDRIGDENTVRDYPYATLYAIERVGVAGGRRYFRGGVDGAGGKEIDWYQRGAGWLLKQQRDDGSYPIEYDVKIASTCFATLFLSRGSAPLAMNKLDYALGKTDEKAPHWNQHPRDVANVTRWIGRQIERDLNWQIVDLDSSVDDWHDAPILYLAGNQPINFSDEHRAKLKQFVEEGGIILGNADCASANFAKSFQSLGRQLFPAYDFAPLPEDHVIYTGEQFPRSKWKRKPVVTSMSNGARELMILLGEADPARAWQAQQATARAEVFELADDIYLYAVDKQNSRRRGESYIVRADKKATATTRAASRTAATTATTTVKVARLQYAGNWDPEPGGWRRLTAVMHNEEKVDLAVEPVELEPGKLDSYRIAHLTGTAAFALDAAAREELRRFVNAGGTLVIDAAGGSGDFAAAAEKEIAATFGSSPELLPADHKLFAGLKSIGYRSYARTRAASTKTPQLRGITIGTRLAVVFSREDLSAGLVGQAVDGIVGYEPETATELMRRIIENAR